MAFSVNTNVSAMAALRTLSTTQSQLNSIQRQIETGLKVAEAKDNPSTFTIAQGMRGDIGSLEAIQEGLKFGDATVNMALAGVGQISKAIIDLNESVTQSFNQGLDINVLQEEVDAVVAQIEAIVNTSVFNGVNLIDGLGVNLDVLSALGGVTQTVLSQDATTTSIGLSNFSLDAQMVVLEMNNAFAVADNGTIQLALTPSGDTHTFEFLDGAGALLTPVNEANGDYVHAVQIDTGSQSNSEIVGILAGVMRSEGFAVNITEDGFIEVAHGETLAVATSVSVVFASETATVGDPIAVLDNAEMLIGQILTSLGTASNRIGSQQDFTQLLVDKMEEGLGILVDANLAEASAELQALQTKEQLGIQSLSIANARPQSILSLFQ